ncbi:MAG: excinuclease ABC subunit UvrA [Pirellulales bacterium]
MRHIEVRGAREHNLRDVSLVLPRNQLIVFTGVSGSGKSSLAFDTLYAEGQRRYLESLSSYARQFIGQLPKPNVDYIAGLSPAVSISQKSTSSNPRSTVGTITEIYDFLRVLTARVGTGHCPECRVPITSQTRDQIVSAIASLTDHKEVLILAPLIQGQKGEHRDLFDSLRRQGYARARVDGQIVPLSSPPQLGRQLRHDIEVVVSRLEPASASRGTISDAVNEALRLGENTLIVTPFTELNESIEAETERPAAARRKRAAKGSSGDIVMSSQYACPKCSRSFAPPTPQLLSFNSPQGMCPECEGLGRQYTFAPQLLIPDTSKSIRRGAVEILGVWNDMSRWQRHQLMGVAELLEKEHGLDTGVTLTQPWFELPQFVRDAWLFGTGDQHVTFTWRGGNRPMKYGGTFAGLIPQLLEQYRAAASGPTRKRFEKYMETSHCTACDGTRLNPQARSIRLQGVESDAKQPTWLSLPEICNQSIDRALHFLGALELSDMELRIAGEAVREVTSRLQFLLDVGLDYLTLARPAPSLSGGEAQRIRLASQIGAGLVGVLYVLDEPSIGLHPRDNDRLIRSLQSLRDQGNSLIVVEHDEDTMRAADLIVDFGPGPGVRGGEVVGFGNLSQLAAGDRSVTGKFLSGAETIPIPAVRRPGNGQCLRIVGASHNNLKQIDIDLPLGKLLCITGVSGSGKSSLIGDILVPVLRRRLHAAEDVPGEHERIDGIEHLDKIIDIDQSPIGRTPRSNPATYVKVFDEIRNIYAELPEAKRRGYAPGRFSFNMAGGRCEACEGNGSNKLEMDFLADLWITCAVCEGRRYNRETLQVRFKDKSIADVLEMDVQQALELFQNVPRVAEKLQTLHDVGLDYLKLGQPSPTLSGGEAQRVKLAKELSRRDTGRTLYLLDEPTTGLHFHDIRLLLKVLQDLVDRGNSVLVIEHNLDIIKAADWIIDLGPEGGASGGEILFEGTPDDILRCDRSHTGQSLQKHLSAPLISSRDKQKADRAKPSKSVKIPNPILKIQGATQHNLKEVSLEIEHNSMTVFCGPSGSGKSSLAMDTIYAEGQRRYVESLSSYARQFVGQMPKPPVERIEGLAPAIAIEQKSVAHNPRSTVGTVTEIYDYLRVLMARLAEPFCPDCGVPVSTQTAEQVTDTLLKHPAGTRLVLTAPLEWQPNQSPADLWQELRTAGMARVRVGGRIYSLESPPRLSAAAEYDLQLVIDRVTVSPENRSRIAESVELALSRGNGVMFAIEADDALDEVDWPTVRHSQHLACRQCGLSLEPLTPHSFSFNTVLGWCPQCEGLGTQSGIDPGLLIDPGKTLAEGAIRSWQGSPTGIALQMLECLAKSHGFSIDIPLDRLTSSQRRTLLHGSGDRWYRVMKNDRVHLQFQWKGLMPTLEHAARMSPSLRNRLAPYTAEIACSACDGSRLSRGPAAARFRSLTVGDLTQMPLSDLSGTLKAWQLDAREQQIAGELLAQITARSEFLLDVGLEYLTLSRSADSLSGGESQRIRLAGQLGSGLCGVLYVLDEPTIGLHPRDNQRLLSALTKLRDLGNTLIVVEHDREIIAGSDELCDFGPGAGRFGGRLTAQGSPKKIASNKSSVTGPYLSGKAFIPIPSNRRRPDQQRIGVRGARAHTLREIDVDFPIGLLTVVTGPSGSGKSTLVNDVLHPALTRKLAKQAQSGAIVRSVEGLAYIDKVIRVDQSPLGSNPSSTPATYTGVFELIRQLYSQLPQSRARGFTARQFSFNVPGGRCEKCEGQGQLRIEMHFLPDVWVICDSCHGRRFTEETLSVKYHDYSIHDVLEMQIGKALEVFSNIPKIRRILQTLVDVGLDYVALGQSAPTLSGGEAQRVKLASELSRPDTGRTLYLLDEPTTGLHFSDVAKLLEVIQRLVDLGNTVIVIEHNLDIIKAADHVIDLGPEAGRGGGRVVIAGTPEEVAAHAAAERAAAGANAKGSVKPSTADNTKSIVEPAKTRTRKGSKGAASQSATNNSVDSVAPLLRSHTGEALIPVLADGKYARRERFDPNAMSTVQEDDVELDHIGRDTLLPWQADGERWHTRDSVDRKGGEIRWDRTLLTWVINKIQSHGGFAAVNWDNRSIVEVTSPVKSKGWFLHAITGETWLLKLKFRVPRASFTKAQLLEVVQLPTLNQMEEIESYGNEPRVKARLAAGGWMELELHPYRLDEINTPKFSQWLDTAMTAFLAETTGESTAVESATVEQHMPWKVLGQRWHTLRKGFPPGREILWPAETLSVLVQVVHQTAVGGRWRWDEQSSAKFCLFGHDQPWITVHTKRPEGLIVMLSGPQIVDRDELSAAMPIPVNWTDRDEGEQILQMAFVETQQPRDSAFRKLLAAHLKAVLQAARKKTP